MQKSSFGFRDRKKSNPPPLASVNWSSSLRSSFTLGPPPDPPPPLPPPPLLLKEEEDNHSDHGNQEDSSDWEDDDEDDHAASLDFIDALSSSPPTNVAATPSSFLRSRSKRASSSMLSDTDHHHYHYRSRSEEHDAMMNGDEKNTNHHDDDDDDDDDDNGTDHFDPSSVSTSAPTTTVGKDSGGVGLAERTRKVFLKMGGFVMNKARKSTGVRSGPSRATAKIITRKKEVQELHRVHCIQRINAHNGAAIWTMEFSSSGLYLATGGADGKVEVFERDKKKQAEVEEAFPSPGEENQQQHVGGISVLPHSSLLQRMKILEGHTSDVTCVVWSKNDYLASSSLDKSVRIWHPLLSDTCLAILRHVDFVTGVDFHPLDDALVLTSCFDRRLRLWDVSLGQCVQHVNAPSYLTCCKFNQTGDFAVTGLYTGHVVFYQVFRSTNMCVLRYFTQIECRNSAGLHKKQRKVTRIQFLNVWNGEHMLVTTNESRCRLYRMDDFSLQVKYRGAINSMLQIGASCSEDGRHVICGSENQQVVVWRVKNDLVKTLFGRHKLFLCDTFEAFRASSSGPVTAALFAPSAMTNDLPLTLRRQSKESTHSAEPPSSLPTVAVPAEDAAGLCDAVILTANMNGVIGVFHNTGQ